MDKDFFDNPKSTGAQLRNKMKNFLSESIKAKQSFAKLRVNPDSKLSYLASLRMIKVDNKKTSFVQCTKCTTVFKYSSYTGNTSIKDHEKTCKSMLNQDSLDSVIKRKMSAKQPDEFKRDVALSLIMDFEKLSLLKREGLLYLIQQSINQASKFQNFYVKDHLPNEAEFDKIIGSLKQEIEEKIKKAVESEDSVNLIVDYLGGCIVLKMVVFDKLTSPSVYTLIIEEVYDATAQIDSMIETARTKFNFENVNSVTYSDDKKSR